MEWMSERERKKEKRSREWNTTKRNYEAHAKVENGKAKYLKETNITHILTLVKWDRDKEERKKTRGACC